MSGFKTTKIELPSGDGKGRRQQPCLTVYDGPELGREFPLPLGTTTIGRDPEGEICIRDSAISRRHLQVTVHEDGACYLEDLNSTNGTRVNEQTVTTQQLADGDRIHVGACLLKFELKSSDAKRYTRKLYELATRDPLTGLLNRNAFMERLQLAWDQSLRSGDPLAVLMCDLDHFKRINDTWPRKHLSGDIVLKRVGEVLSTQVRRPDVVARYGGEEFILLLPGADEETGRLTAERLREAIEALDWEEVPSEKVTASIGICSRAVQADGSPTAILEAADRALYRAKEEGRNRCCISE